jgi:hypothetical protein
MNKKNNMVYFMLIIVGLLGSLTLNIFAQKAEIPKTETSQPTCTGEKFHQSLPATTLLQII